MSKYLDKETIGNAVQRLADSRANSTLLDYLIFRRALSLKQSGKADGAPENAEEGDKGILVLDSLHKETVDEQYKRLFLESALPVAIDNGEEMIVSSYGGKHQEGHPFPEHVTLLHRDANGNEVFGMYEFVLAEEAPDKE